MSSNSLLLFLFLECLCCYIIYTNSFKGTCRMSVILITLIYRVVGNKCIRTKPTQALGHMFVCVA